MEPFQGCTCPPLYSFRPLECTLLAMNAADTDKVDSKTKCFSMWNQCIDFTADRIQMFGELEIKV